MRLPKIRSRKRALRLLRHDEGEGVRMIIYNLAGSSAAKSGEEEESSESELERLL